MKHTNWSNKELLENQLENAKRIINYAYNYVPFYHRKMKKSGISTHDIVTLSDLNKFPITRKPEIMKSLKSTISRRFPSNILRVLSTSGSTGHPLKVYITKEEDSFRKAKHLRANICCGQKPFDRWVTITSPTHFGEVSKLQRVLRLYSPCFVSVFDNIKEQVSTIEKARPQVLDGYSSSLVLLAKEVESQSSKRIRPRIIFGGAEMIDDSSRALVERVLEAPFYDQYATVEMERIAWQCPFKIGYHIDADAIIVQFVDKDGEEVSPGETGEIVCTSLFNYAMPFIRYAIGDIGVPSDEHCPCGNSLPLMKMIEGRRDSFIILPHKRLLSPRTFTIAMNTFNMISCVDQFHLIQKSLRLIKIKLKLKKKNKVNREVIGRRLVSHLENTLGIDTGEVVIEIEFVENIPLKETGKLAIVSSELN